jgi:hypothetical protein
MVAKQTLIDIARAQQVSNFRLLNQMCTASDVKVLTYLTYNYWTCIFRRYLYSFARWAYLSA